MRFLRIVGEGAKTVAVAALAAYIAGIMTGMVGAFWIDVLEPLVGYYGKGVRDHHVPYMMAGTGAALCLVFPYLYIGGMRWGLMTWFGVTVATAIYAWKRGGMQIELEYLLFSLMLGLWGFAVVAGLGRIVIFFIRQSRV